MSSPSRAGKSICKRSKISVAVVLGLEGSVDRHADVLRLLRIELRQLDPQLLQVQAGDLFVQFLGSMWMPTGYLPVFGPERDLGEHLVGEAVGHDERGMSRRAAQVDQPSFGQHDDRLAVREDELVDLRLDVDAADVLAILQVGHFDFGIEVADVADDRFVLHHVEVLAADDVAAAGGRDEDVALRRDFFHRGDLVPFHRRLQGADRDRSR